MQKQSVIWLASVFLLTGCQSYFGPSALRNTHPAYTQAIVTSLNQEMLLNLVRLKYRDQPYFLRVSSVTAAMNFSGNLGLSTQANGGIQFLQPNVGIGYEDNPTLSYSPLQGEDFLKSIMSPISLEAILVMTQSGWSIERVFGICVERINNLFNAAKASGPTPALEPDYKDFKQTLSLLGIIQSYGDMEIGPEKNRQNDVVDLVMLFKTRYVKPDVLAKLSNLLDIEQKKGTAAGRVRISNNFVDLQPDQLTIRTRSISSILFYLSQNIEIPKAHREAGLVTITKTQSGTVFDWNDTPAGAIFKIKSSESEPENAYLSVPYRGYWFYIDDNDLQSKSTFMLLSQLFDLQAGQTKFNGPTLTLPIR